MQVANVVNKDL